MKKHILLILLTLFTLSAYSEQYAFLFSNGTYAISSNPFEYAERVARLSNFQITTQTSEVVYEKADWAIQAEQLFYQGMIVNGFGDPPWTNQTFESVGIQLLLKSVNGETEEERNTAARWKGVLESVFNSLLDYHNGYRKQFSESEITAIWEYPLNGNIIYSNTISRSGIIYENVFYSK